MSREDHYKALEKYRDGILSGGITVPHDELITALDAALTALRGAPSWVRTEDRLPTEADSWHGFVLAGSGKGDMFGEEVSIEHIGTVPTDEHWPYWAPISPLPDEWGAEK